MPHPLIHDWNLDGARPRGVAMLDDETLRDGLQSPSVRTPSHRREDRHPSENGRARHRHRQHRPSGCRTAGRRRRRAPRAGDCRAPSEDPAELRGAHRDGRYQADRRDFPANRDRRSSAARSSGRVPIRQYTEGWTLDFLQKTTEDAISFAVREGLKVMYVTEDTTRADPAIASGALHDGAPVWRVAAVHRRHGRPCHAGGRRRGRSLM